MQQRCRITGSNFEVSAAEIDFLRRAGALVPFLGEALPLPTISPVERNRRLTPWGNLIHLFRAKSSLSGHNQLSRYRPDSGVKVCTQDEFWSDEVENLDQGRNYDFSRPFFEQFKKLFYDCTIMPHVLTNSENCEYANGVYYCRNCYLCFTSGWSEDCLYCFNHFHGNDNIDCVFCEKCQFCYASSDLSHCYECQHCRDCVNCASCVGCFDCIGCNDCFGCVGLQNQRYCAFNEQLSAEDYAARLAELNLASYSARARFLSRMQSFIDSQAREPNRLIQCENSTGGYLRSCRNMHSCYNGFESEDCGYLMTSVRDKNCWYGYMLDCEMCTMNVAFNATNSHYSYQTYASEGIWYSFAMYQSSANCFGCVGLKRKSYCILNKQYSKEEYLEIVPRIVSQMKQNGEWGEFFPLEFAPHPYEDLWCDFYLESLTPTEAKKRGYRFAGHLNTPPPSDPIPATAIPDELTPEATRDFPAKAIICVQTGDVFQYAKKELEHYARFGIPPPRVHWRARMSRAMTIRDRMSASSNL